MTKDPYPPETTIASIPELSTRAKHCLLRDNLPEFPPLKTVGQVRDTLDDDLIRRPLLGKKTLREIRHVIGPDHAASFVPAARPSSPPPKDGTPFLAFWPCDHGWTPVIVAWMDLPPKVIRHRTGPFWWRRTITETRDQTGYRILIPTFDGNLAIHGNYLPFEPNWWWPLPQPWEFA